MYCWFVCYLMLLSHGSVSGNEVATGDPPINKTLTLGLMMPSLPHWSVAENMAATIVPAVDAVVRMQLLPGYDVSWIWEDTACQPQIGTIVISSML